MRLLDFLRGRTRLFSEVRFVLGAALLGAVARALGALFPWGLLAGLGTATLAAQTWLAAAARRQPS